MHFENDGTRQSLLEACQIVLQRIVEIRDGDCQAPMVQAAIRDAGHYLEQAYAALENMDAKVSTGPRDDFADFFNTVSENLSERIEPGAPGPGTAPPGPQTAMPTAAPPTSPMAPAASDMRSMPSRTAPARGAPVHPQDEEQKIPVQPLADPVGPRSFLPDPPPALRPRPDQPAAPTTPAADPNVQGSFVTAPPPEDGGSRRGLPPIDVPAPPVENVPVQNISLDNIPSVEAPPSEPSLPPPVQPPPQPSAIPQGAPKPAFSGSAARPSTNDLPPSVPSPAPQAPAAPPLPDAAAASRQRGLRGYTQSMSLADLISFICVQGNDGVLRVTTKLETVEMYFEKGNLVHARSNNTPAGHRLGEILVRQGVVDQRVVDGLLSRYGGSMNLLGEALERDQYVTPQQVQAALEEQAQALFLRLFAQEDAYFAFSEGLPANTDRRINLNVTHLMLESARIQDEAGAPPTTRQ